MKYLSTKHVFYRVTIGLLSMLIIWLASFGNHSSFVNKVKNEKVVETVNLPDNGQENSPEETFKIVAYEAVLPLIHANVSVLLYFFTKIQLTFDVFIEVEEEFQLPFISYFNTLFRLIISPNAP